MKISIIRKKYTFHGGAESFSRGFIDLLAGEGHEIHIYAIQWEGGETKKNIFIHRVNAVTFNSLLRDLTFAILSRRLLVEEKFDIIQSHDKTFLQDIYRAGDGCHSEWLRQRWKRTGLFGRLSILLNPYHWLVLGMERLIFKRRLFRKVIAISDMVKQDIMRHYRVPSEDITVIYNPVELDKFRPDIRVAHRRAIRESYGIDMKDFVLLFVGSGFERKGVRYLIEAAELLEAPVTVMIVGKGPKDKYRRFAKKQRIIFCGPQEYIERFYAAGDAFVFPTMYEPFGNVHLEALASGLPVITTKHSGGSEIIENGKSGFVVSEPEDIRAIAESIKKLMNREALAEMSIEARKTAEKFTAKRYVSEMMQLYRDILEIKQVLSGSSQ